MKTIISYEFYNSFKSFKSILIILFFTLSSILTAHFLSNQPSLTNSMHSGSVYTSSIKLLVFFFGFLFVSSISHDVINKELDFQTIRLLVTKTSKGNIIFGKFLGVFLFWVVSTTACFIIVSLYAKQWFFLDYTVVIIFLFFIVTITLFLSTIIAKPGLTMFIGIFIGIIAPILGFWAAFSTKWFLIPFRYFLPYYYVVQSNGYLIFPALFGFILLFISYFIFKRKDL
ncbi:ABC transporter permease subunit [Neobacillus sp. PS3-40]|uniref:ABC transporter permease subunit n=1 Tax=Neobacillus sp. PS3-40 TaxID=3070679 RepID=UPI0035A83602